jgi:hypothetical protein
MILVSDQITRFSIITTFTIMAGITDILASFRTVSSSVLILVFPPGGKKIPEKSQRHRLRRSPKISVISRLQLGGVVATTASRRGGKYYWDLATTIGARLAFAVTHSGKLERNQHRLRSQLENPMVTRAASEGAGTLEFERNLL